MFRRRGAGRGLRGRLQRWLRPAAPLRPPDPAFEALQEAQRMEALGHYAEAAELYERLAYLAQQMARPRQAARLYLRAGQCRIQGGQANLGFPDLQQAFRLLAAAQDWPALQRLGWRSEAWLRQQGHPTQADELQRLVQTLLEENLPPESRANAARPATPAAQRPARLPTHCPNCGAALRPSEIEWLDPHTAECAYCGSPVPVTSK